MCCSDAAVDDGMYFVAAFMFDIFVKVCIIVKLDNSDKNKV
jgi:hypothetical protein